MKVGHLISRSYRLKMKKRFGKIVFISSVVAHTGNPSQTNYSASKAAISGLVNLGYSQIDASKAIAEILNESNSNLSIEEVIRAALKILIIKA